MKTFEEILKHERLKKGLSATKLSEMSGLHVSLISALERGYRCIGEKSARKLSVALGLRDKEQAQFIYSAMEESADRLLKKSESYPVELLNYLPVQLQKMKITHELIRDFSEQENKLIIFLENSNLIQIETKLLMFEPFIKYT
jgi:transcriptional regulator with XRE-family HTH domain